MAKRHVYREVKYIVGMDPHERAGEVTFFPMIQLEGHGATRIDSDSFWSAEYAQGREMTLAYGAAQAECDQLNARLQAKGLNRLREVS